MIDPLDGLERYSIETQVAVIASEVRNQKNTLLTVRAELAALRKTLVGFAVTIASSSLVFAATIFVVFR